MTTKGVLTQERLFSHEYAARVISVCGGSLIGYWPLFEKSGSVARDYGRYKLNGSYSNVSLNQSGIGDGRVASSFDGTTSYVNIYSTGLVTRFNPFEGTLMAWAKVSGVGVWTDGIQHNLVNLTSDSSNTVAILKPSTNNTISFQYLAGGTNKSVSTTAFGGVTGWLSVVITFSVSSGAMKAFANGMQVGTTQTSLGTWAGSLSTLNTAIGARVISPINPWSGSCAHVALCDRPLLAQEIQALAVL